MRKILSLDPGGTTGIAQVTYSESEGPVLDFVEQVEGGLLGFLGWWNGLESRDWDAIVCEDFVLRPSVKFPDLSPVYIIGALTALVGVLTLQSPSLKPLCNDEVLKRMEFYTKGKPHGNDATRHAIIYLRHMRHKPTLLKGWPQ
jgi:hypothetical protein